MRCSVMPAITHVRWFALPCWWALCSQADNGSVSVTFGYAITRQQRHWECPPGYDAQTLLCEPPSPDQFSFGPDGAPVITRFEVRGALRLLPQPLPDSSLV